MRVSPQAICPVDITGKTGTPSHSMAARIRHEPLITGGILAAALMLWSWFRLSTGIRLEDALITFRYAGHLAGGDGFVYNVGERVLGTTTPLLTLILGGIGALAGVEAIPVAAVVVGMAAMAGAALLAFDVLTRLGASREVGWLTMIMLCLHPGLIWMTTGGMETPLVLFFMAAGLSAAARRAYGWAGLACGLLVVTRIDGAVWALGMGLLILLRGRRELARALLAGAAVSLPWAVFSAWYFGTIIPHSIVAKRVIGGGGGPLDRQRFEAFAAWSAPFVGACVPFLVPLGLVVFAAGAGLCLRRAVPAPLWLAPLFTLAFPAVLWLGGSPLYFDWYLGPVIFTAILTAGAGMGRLLGPARPGRAAGAALAAVAVAWTALTGAQVPAVAREQRDYQINEDGTRRAIGMWLARETPPDAAVAMEAIGYQGYYSGRRVIDMAGLVSPRVVAIRQESHSNAEAFHRILLELRPDYLVLRSFEVDRNAHYHGGRLFETNEQIAWFAGHYEEAQRFAAPLPQVWGPTSYLTVYRRIARDERTASWEEP